MLVTQYRVVLDRTLKPESPDNGALPLEGVRVVLVGDPGHREGYEGLLALYGATMDFVDGMTQHRITPVIKGLVIIVTAFVKHALVDHVRATVGADVDILYMDQAGLVHLQDCLQDFIARKEETPD